MARRKYSYLQNAALLTACGLVLRVLGMGFRVALVVLPGRRGHGPVPADFSGVHGIRLAGHSGHQCSLGPAGGTKPGPGAGHGGYPAGALRYSHAVSAAAPCCCKCCWPSLPPGISSTIPAPFWLCRFLAPACPLWRRPGRCAAAFWRHAGYTRMSLLARRTDHPHGNRHRRTACAGPMGCRLRLCRRSTGQHGQRGHLLRPHVRLCRQNAGVCPPRR